MRLGIDARMLGKGYGLGRTIECLIKAFVKNAPQEHEYVVFVRLESQVTHLRLPTSFQIIVADIPWYSLKEQLLYPKILRKAKLDLLFVPHWNVSWFYTGPYVVMIHDLIMFHHSRIEASTRTPLHYYLKDTAHRFLVRHVTKKAKHVVVASEYVRQDVYKTLRVPLTRMTVIYQAPFPQDFKVQTKDTVEALGIHSPYVLYVGAAYPHKNVSGLIRAWQEAKVKIGDNASLVLVGQRNPFYERVLSDPSVIRDRSIIYTGFVDDTLLSTLYRYAMAAVIPSLSEGFGFGVLEAYMAGTPVISSNRTCLPEVAGQGAFYVNPEDVTVFSNAIVRVWQDKQLQETLRTQGKDELKRFSWDKTAAQILVLLGNVFRTK